MKNSSSFRYILLAGERPGGNALAQEFKLPVSVLVGVGGQACINWVLQALQNSQIVDEGILCGPSQDVVVASSVFGEALERFPITWLAPEAGPAASAKNALATLNHYPALITTADHALLTANIIDEFCTAALKEQKNDLDFVVGLVPHESVTMDFPNTKRTLLRFTDGNFCGSNLFAVLNSRGARALALWQEVESERKTPWKIARRLSFAMMLKYVTGRLSLEQVFEILSRQSECRVGYVLLKHARAAIDVDSKADWLLADELLTREGKQAIVNVESVARTES